MDIKKFILIIMVCLFAFSVSGQTSNSPDTSYWYVYLFENEEVKTVEYTEVIVDNKTGHIQYKNKGGKFIKKEKDFCLSRQKLTFEEIMKYHEQ